MGDPKERHAFTDEVVVDHGKSWARENRENETRHNRRAEKCARDCTEAGNGTEEE